jgi:uncharacterized lipoprotein YmbA
MIDKDSAAFLKKRNKKLWLLGDVAPLMPQPAGEELFCFFFFKKRSAVLLALLGLALLTGCSPPAQDYRLQAEPGPVVNAPGLSVGVRSVGIPGYLDQNNIGMTSKAYQYATYPNDVWAEGLADMLQAEMVQELAQRLPGATVIASGGAIGAPIGVVVEMNVLRFDPDPDGQIDLTVQISVRRGSDQRLYRTVAFERRLAPAEGGAVGVVAAMSALWGQAADQVAALLAMESAGSPG